MRKKDQRPDALGVADGFDFGADGEKTIEKKPEAISHQPAEKKMRIAKKAEIDPDRAYSPYYTPRPKVGSNGGTLGRGAVDASERKVQFSLTCTPAQKEAFANAAKAEKRKLPEFICLAVEEYIENHGL